MRERRDWLKGVEGVCSSQIDDVEDSRSNRYHVMFSFCASLDKERLEYQLQCR